MRIRKFFFIFYLIFSLSYAINAQKAVDPSDSFYQDALNWYLKGYVSYLPIIKPYPVNVIISILQEVTDSNDQKAKEKAEEYLNDFAKFYGISSQLKLDAKLKQLENGDIVVAEGDEEKKIKKYQDYEIGTFGLNLFGDYAFSEKLSTSYDIAFRMNDNTYEFTELLPSYLVESENSRMSGLSFSNSNNDFRFNPNINLFAGDKRIYGSIGFSKASYGFYEDGSNVLSQESFPAFNSTFSYYGDRVHFMQYSAILAGRNEFDEDLSRLNKFFFLRSVEFLFFQGKLSLSYYESAVSSINFLPFNFLPLPTLIMNAFVEQEQNAFAGLGITLRPLPCIAITGDIYVDDIEIQEIFKRNFNQSAARLAFKSGFIYSPYNSMCSNIVADYTLVTPYTFTSDCETDGYNVRDYTNFTLGMASKLPPNSDMISLKVNFEPIKGFTVGTKTAFMRHANSYEDLTESEVLALFKNAENIPCSDGSIRMTEKECETAVTTTNFLTQDHVMYVIQAGINGGYKFKIKNLIDLTFSGEYTFEYIRDDGVNKNIYTSSYLTEEEVQNAKSLWKKSLHASYNHYFSLFMKISY